MAIHSLEDALVEELRDMLDAEKQILKALTKMAKSADSEELANAFEEHKQETEEQVERLGEALEQLGKPIRGKTCDGIKGIIKENEGMMKEVDQGPICDALMIGGAQKVEHYEIASYGTAIAWAKELGENRIASILSKSLEEEKAADEKLTEISETLNKQAGQEESEEEVTQVKRG